MSWHRTVRAAQLKALNHAWDTSVYGDYEFDMAAAGYLKFTIAPTGAGTLDFRYRDGDDSGAAAPLQPTLSTPSVLSSSSLSLALQSPATGGVEPYAYELERSAVSASSGFSQIATGTQAAVFSSNDLYVDTGLTGATQYWYRLRVTDSDSPARTSLYSEVVTAMTAAVVGDTTKPTTPTLAADPFSNTTSSGTTFTLLTEGTDDVAVTGLTVGYGLATGVTSSTSGTPVAGTWTPLFTNRPIASGLSFDIPGEAGQSYYVRASSVDAAGHVSESATAHRYITLPTPAAGGTALFDLPLSTATTLAGASLALIEPRSTPQGEPVFSTAHARVGAKSLKFTHLWANTSPGSAEGDRQECGVTVSPFTGSTADNASFPFGAEFYYGWSILLDSTYPVDEFSTVLMQFHQHGGTIVGASPPFQLSTTNGTDRLQFSSRYQRESDGALIGYQYKEIGPVVRNKQLDFRMRVKWHNIAANAALQCQYRVPVDSATWTDINFPDVGVTRGNCFRGSDTAYGPELRGGLYVYHQNRVAYPNYTPNTANQTHIVYWGYAKMSNANDGTWDLVTPSGSGF